MRRVGPPRNKGAKRGRCRSAGPNRAAAPLILAPAATQMAKAATPAAAPVTATPAAAQVAAAAAAAGKTRRRRKIRRRRKRRRSTRRTRSQEAERKSRIGQSRSCRRGAIPRYLLFRLIRHFAFPVSGQSAILLARRPANVPFCMPRNEAMRHSVLCFLARL